MTPITFTVLGVPQSQGSIRAFMPKGCRRPILTSTNPKLKQWRRSVAVIAQRTYRGPALDGPMQVVARFYLPAPKALKRMTPHTKRPDLDKYLRALLDSLTGIIFRDDSQVCCVDVSKHYALGSEPRAVITVTPLTEEGTLFS
jgi:Holliday junction resolvase RusA-like endonuclease